MLGLARARSFGPRPGGLQLWTIQAMISKPAYADFKASPHDDRLLARSCGRPYARSKVCQIGIKQPGVPLALPPYMLLYTYNGRT